MLEYKNSTNKLHIQYKHRNKMVTVIFPKNKKINSSDSTAQPYDPIIGFHSLHNFTNNKHSQML